MRKKLTIVVLFQLVAFTMSIAQKIYVEVKSEFNITNLKFDWNSSVDNQSDTDGINYNFSIGLSGQVYKDLYLKATVGSNDIQHFIEIDWESPFNDDHRLVGVHSMSQNYLEILPEYRVEKGVAIIYINAGIGFSQIRDSKFLGGSYRINQEAKEIYEFPVFRGRYEYFTANIGASFNYKRIGFIAALGFRNSGFTDMDILLPEIGMNQISLKFGLSYRLN